MFRSVWSAGGLARLIILALSGTNTVLAAEACTAQILSRSVRIDRGQSFVIDNVPSNQGLGRVLFICQDENGVTGGTSRFVRIPAGGTVGVGQIELGPIPLGVKSLSLAVTPSSLAGPGATAKITVTATMSDESTRDVTDSVNGTTYTISNSAFGTVDSKGLVTAGSQSGTVVVGVMNDGVFASKLINVSLSNDSDGDGMPDDFEEAHSCLWPTLPDAADDPDFDGLSNLDEYTRGTDPCSADTDGDGLNDGQEIALGSNPTLADSDGDGLLDGNEPNPGGDADGDGLINILDSDQDNDGLPDGIEVRLVNNPIGASPTADNDGDGLNNLDEVQIGTDPSKADTDLDGINDGDEVLLGITDPLNPDSDGDGFIDGLEVEANSDPNDPASRPFDPNKSIGEVDSAPFSMTNNVVPPGNIPRSEVSTLPFSTTNNVVPPGNSPRSEVSTLPFSVHNTASP